MFYKLHKLIIWGLSIILILLLLPSTLSFSQSNPKNQIQTDWAWPLDGEFMVIKEAKYGTIVNNTAYGVRNLDLVFSLPGNITCFNVGWHSTYHAGVDLYMADGNTAGQLVKSVANGQVKHIIQGRNDTTVIIEHEHPTYTKIWSIYWHLVNVQVSVGNNVLIGDSIGEIYEQSYTGRFPDVHPFGADDSHLHFEIRTFEDGSNLFPNYPNCNRVVGPAYTYPDPPNAYGYLDPLEFINNQLHPNHIYVPLVFKPSSMYSEC